MLGDYHEVLSKMESSSSSKGNRVRQKRKGLDHSANTSILNTSVQVNSKGASASLLASPRLLSPYVKRASTNDSVTKTPSRTPSKSPATFLSVTPGRKTPALDRFIPSRSGTDYEKSHFRVVYRDLTAVDDSLSPSKREFQLKMVKSLMSSSEFKDRKVLNFQRKDNNDSESSLSNSGIFLRSPSLSAKKSLFENRKIPSAPERILDAPDVVNDYYLNLIDWSSTNLLAVALGPSVYLWNADQGEIHHLMETEFEDDYICGLKWTSEGKALAVGLSNGDVELWDPEKSKKIRTLAGHSARVASLSWNKHILSSGSRSGEIMHSDVRHSRHELSKFQAHSAEVCGLSWSPDGRNLASGSNDNQVKIWEAREEISLMTTPKYTFTHRSAVKAIAWCPWQPTLLATGGGFSDKTIKVWNVSNGSLMNSVDTGAQVSSLLWSSEFRELVSGHGLESNEVSIWKYPSMVKTAQLLGHTDRVLNIALSPDETTVVSFGADETLRLWKCFLPDPSREKKSKKGPLSTSITLRPSIR